MSNSIHDTVAVFFGFDERFSPYAYVSLSSLISHCNPNRKYEIHILYTDLSEKTGNLFRSLSKDNVTVFLDDISDRVSDVMKDLPIRDYYSVSTYFRIIIAESFPQYDKALYIDSDTVIEDDVSKLFDTKLGSRLVGGVKEAVMAYYRECGDYAKKVVGVKASRYFNAEVILINSKAWREEKVLEKFIELSSFYDFRIAQDQDYLNVICKDRVYYLSRKWNMECIHGWNIPEGKMGIIHFAFAPKPWHDAASPYSTHFWKYAQLTPLYSKIKQGFAKYTDTQLRIEKETASKVIEGCLEEIDRPDNYLKRLAMAKKRKNSETNGVSLPERPIKALA